MADHRAIWAVCGAVIELLRRNYEKEYFDGNELEFKVFTHKDFKGSPIGTGVSLFLYRIDYNQELDKVKGHRTPNGKKSLPPLPLDLHFMLTPWGKDTVTQLGIAGWIMRMMYDCPFLPAGFLNSLSPGMFRPAETVEIYLDELRSEDAFNIKEAIGASLYNPSIPYVARKVIIESYVIQPEEKED